MGMGQWRNIGELKIPVVVSFKALPEMCPERLMLAKLLKVLIELFTKEAEVLILERDVLFADNCQYDCHNGGNYSTAGNEFSPHFSTAFKSGNYCSLCLIAGIITRSQT
jgi:hypothetical protein